MIDLTTYTLDKTAGLKTVAAVGNQLVVTVKTFDPKTGTPINSITVVSLEEANQLLANLQAQVGQVQAFISDLNAAAAGSPLGASAFS
jgi:hypothetical protein